MADDIITSDQIGEGDSKTYGADIGPTGGQDMWQIDTIAGTVHDRDASPAEFTGGDSGRGLGGMAEPMAPGGDRYERRGF
jgi:hypothetical protein